MASRLEKLVELEEHGATSGERRAAQAALDRALWVLILPEHLRPVRGPDGIACFTESQADQICALYPDLVNEFTAADGRFLAVLISLDDNQQGEFDVLGRICPTV